MDITKLSDADLVALKAGDLSKVSDAGLMELRGAPQSQGVLENIGKGTINAGMGFLKGASDIGATALQPVDWLLNKTGVTSMTNAERRQELGNFFKEHADPNALEFKGGELGADIAGTAGIGPEMAAGVRALPMLGKYGPQVASALESGGFRLATPATTIPGRIANAALRMGAGGAVGAASAGTINPDDAGSGFEIGAILPAAVKVAGSTGSAINNGLNSSAQYLMQSALKPTIEQLRSGKAATAVRTLLDEGINPTKAGVDALRGRIDDVNNQITTAISNSNATVSKQGVLDTLNGTRQRFSNQVSPTADLGSIQNVADDFSSHPLLPNDPIPVQLAQELKQGTYGILKNKYGQLGSAETEAQKALARGLKEGIANAVPDVGPMNARESRLIDTLSVAERRALMDANKNPMGLSILAGNPTSWAAFMADKSALFKSIAARMANQAGSLAAPTVNPYLIDALRQGAIVSGANPALPQ